MPALKTNCYLIVSWASDVLAVRSDNLQLSNQSL